MRFFLIDVDSITYNNTKDHSKFNNFTDRLADAILESGDIINPLVVKKVGFDSYELVYGEIEYYAAVKASEIDPRKGEMIGAFVIEDEQQEPIKRQVELLRKSLSNEQSTGDSQSLNSEVVSTVNSNYNKLNSVQKDINQIHEKLESLMEMNTAKGLRKLLTKQLESIISEAETKSKQEAIQYLKNSQTELRNQQKKIEDQILELSKVNLLDITYDQLSELMQQVKGKSNQIKASWKAIEYWRKSDQGLTWDNLRKSTVNANKEKIDGFADGSYKILKKVAYL